MNKLERQQIRLLIQMPQWTAVQHLAEMLCAKWNSQTKGRDTEWETIKATLTDEGMVKGIQQFLQELMKQIDDQD